jgi:hypothetical protein
MLVKTSGPKARQVGTTLAFADHQRASHGYSPLAAGEVAAGDRVETVVWRDDSVREWIASRATSEARRARPTQGVLVGIAVEAVFLVVLIGAHWLLQSWMLAIAATYGAVAGLLLAAAKR